jgi:hypothetical protein
MCDDEDFASQGPSGEHSAHEDVCKNSFTLTSADRRQAYNRVKGKGVAEHRRLPSIEEEDVVGFEPRAVRPEPAALSQVVDSDRSSPQDKERSIMVDSADATSNEPLNKRYGRVTLSQVTTKTDSVLQSRESQTSLIPWSSSRDVSPNIMTATAPLRVGNGAPEKQVSSSSSSPVRGAADGKQLDVRKPTVPQESSAQSAISVAPPRSRLVPVQSAIPGRPVLQQVNTNTVATSSLIDDGIATPDTERIGVKPSAKQLGKRRGVIMVEKQNIISVAVCRLL